MTQRREIPFGRPWMTHREREAVATVLDGPILTHGPHCSAFEKRFASFMGDGAHCVSMSSCMAALHMAWFHLGVGPGDEVICPAMTHVATAHAIELTGARPVFVDCDASGNIDPVAVEAAITPNTRGITLVHFLGVPCDMAAIMDIARRHDLRVVEDCALAVGTRLDGVHAGLFGDAGCFSFYPVKHLTTAEGGMLVTRDADAAVTVARKRAFGVDRTHADRSMPGVYDVDMLGMNCRMSELQAALGLAQLERVDEMLARRRENFRVLSEGLGSLENVRVLGGVSGETSGGVSGGTSGGVSGGTFGGEAGAAIGAGAQSSHYCLSVVLEGPLSARRPDLAASLRQAGIGFSVYYPHPVPRLTYYREKYGWRDGEFPNARAVSDSSVALPVGPHLGVGDMEYVAETFSNAVKEL
ncbi:dTDP-4-amino-4,6-dideoxygalactose transaminase [Desulfobaculum xiamenense]|uniref:dTDP-4-amino-4,6-dideoxygalactose transaminase n=1 Tax=Desulfobaculum xiamenense TaxID=995050 RepID=A0A846QPF1_9BACT|nr:DegT/DnrJ/EryC1/StrS family aminotransferase [Desulfobaculum xiamenense]NJB67094.1 dTDP-4-amino-4,6-dideoxygalactose transaminase [Desulfobaculum xiamenense]